MKHFLFLSVIIFSAAGRTEDVIHLQPAEIIEATPLDTFSDRTGNWNTDRIRTDHLGGGGRSIFESLNEIPGVQARSEGSPTLSIRGSAAYARVLGLWDGIPLNTLDGFGADQMLIPMETTSSLLLLRGPASLFYGANAMGGAINFIPRLYDRPVARLELGSFSERGLFGAAPLIEKSDDRVLQATAYNTDTSGNYGFSSLRTGATGVREPNDKHLQRFTLSARQKLNYWQLSENVIWAEESGASLGPIVNPTATWFKRKAGLASIDASWQANDDNEWKFRAFQITKRRNYWDNPRSNYDSDRTGLTTSWRARYSKDFYLEIFIDQFFDRYSSDASQIDSYEASSEAGAIADVDFGDGWALKAGARLLSNPGIAVPTVGLIRDDATRKTWVTYSEGYRVPSLTDRFSTAYNFVVNQALRPEIAKQIELGFVEHSPVTYGITAYSTEYQDLIVSKKLPSGSYQMQNVRSARATGVEGQVAYNYDVWSFSGAISNLYAFDTQENTALPLSPEIQSLVMIGYMWGPVVFEAKNTWWGNYYDNGSTQNLGPWNTLDLSARSVGFTDWNWRVHAYNIFDTPRELTLGYPEPQRRFQLSVERAF